jgi:UPF0271 protein
MINVIDLNSDIGEVDDEYRDARIIELVSSVNISCGVHAGTLERTRRTILMASEKNVAVGAHPGMPDSFGRSEQTIDVRRAYDEVVRQLTAFKKAANEVGTIVNHVKPHGALYNQVEQRKDLKKSVVDAIVSVFPGIKVYALAGGNLFQYAHERGLNPVGEFFADRVYLPNCTLISRTIEGSVISDPEEVSRRVVKAVIHGKFTASDDNDRRITFDSICVHGDTDTAVSLVEIIRSDLRTLNIRIESVP